MHYPSVVEALPECKKLESKIYLKIYPVSFPCGLLHDKLESTQMSRLKM